MPPTFQDLYRAENGADPVRWEKTLAKLEDFIAPLLSQLFMNPTCPNRDELYALQTFAAVQFIRVPTFRPFVERVAKENYRDALSSLLRDRKHYNRAMKKHGLSDKVNFDQAVEYQRDVIDKGAYNLRFPNEYFIQRGFAGLNTILEQLQRRSWHALISPTGSFLGSDSPIVMDGEGQIGFKTAEVIHFPVNRFLLLRGTVSQTIEEWVTRNMVAAINIFALLNTQEQVYSPNAEFPWRDENARTNCDWRSFSKTSIIQSLQATRTPAVIIRTRAQ